MACEPQFYFFLSELFSKTVSRENEATCSKIKSGKTQKTLTYNLCEEIPFQQTRGEQRMRKTLEPHLPPFVLRSVLPPSLPLQHHSPVALPGARDKELSKSWVLFKRFYRQVNSEINAGTQREQSARGRKRNPDSAGRGSLGNRDSRSPSQTYPWQRKPR